MKRNTIVVDIVDDHKMVLGGLRDMLKSLPGIRVGNIYNSGSDLLAGLTLKEPDVLLLDIQMPDVRGDELAALISKTYPAIKIIAITGYNTKDYAKLMLDAGVSGYLLKNTDEHKLLCAIETVYNGEQYIEPSIKERLNNDARDNSVFSPLGVKPTLTRREKDMLRLILDEMTSQEIADKLGLSLRTIENHRVSLMQKLDAKNLAGIVKRCFQLRLLD